MKKFVLIILLLMLLQLCGCTHSNNIDANKIITNDDIMTSEEAISLASPEVELACAYEYPITGAITLCVDPRVELLYLAANYMNDEPVFYFEDTSYFQDARKVFDASKEHDFFHLLFLMSEQGFKYGELTNMLNIFDSEHKLKPNIDLSSYTLQQRSYLDLESNLMWFMMQYRETSAFEHFFVSHESLYNAQLKLAAQRMTTARVIERMEEFYGQSLENTTISLTPFRNYGFSAIHARTEGNYETLITLSVAESDIEFISVIIHELSHRYVNVDTQHYPNLVAKSEWRFKPFESQEFNEIYSNWKIVYNEYMVRAITCILIEEIYGDAELQKQIALQVSDGFTDIEDAINLVMIYKENRKDYQNFQEFSPILMEEFSSHFLNSLNLIKTIHR